MALIFPPRYEYVPVLLSGLVLLAFTAVIPFRLFHSPLISKYVSSTWIAVSVNLLFATIILVILIRLIFEGLQQSIAGESRLQERYKNIFNQSPQPMWVYELSSLRFLDVNDAAIRHYGYSREEFLAMSIRDIRKPDTVAALEAAVAASKATGQFF